MLRSALLIACALCALPFTGCHDCATSHPGHLHIATEALPSGVLQEPDPQRPRRTPYRRLLTPGYKDHR